MFFHYVDHSTLPDPGEMRRCYYAPTAEDGSTVIVDRHGRTSEEFLLHATMRVIPYGLHLLSDCIVKVDSITPPWYWIRIPTRPRTSTGTLFDNARVMMAKLAAYGGVKRLYIHVPGQKLYKDVRLYQYSPSENDVDVE